METRGRLIVDVARLDPAGEWHEGETAREVMDLEANALSAPLGGIVYKVFVQAVGAELLARGVLRMRARCVCARCGGAFDADAIEPAYVASFEINEQTEFLDLTGDIREAIILTLPDHPVCREDCQGVCPKCGADLNRRPCACGAVSGDDRWSALEQWL